MDVEPSVPLMPPFVDHPPRKLNVEGSKATVRAEHIKNHHCLIYGAGIADDSRFEQSMALQGCDVHAFDYSIDASAASVQGKAFHYHAWCISEGSEADFKNTPSSHGYVSKTLQTIMADLKHTKIDLMKFDIEGYESALLRGGILTAPQLPDQLSFELHTFGAKPVAVPETNVLGKRRHAVDQLFLTLHDRGYRVVSKEINPFDHHCAEFVLLHVDGLKASV